MWTMHTFYMNVRNFRIKTASPLILNTNCQLERPRWWRHDVANCSGKSPAVTADHHVLMASYRATGHQCSNVDAPVCSHGWPAWFPDDKTNQSRLHWEFLISCVRENGFIGVSLQQGSSVCFPIAPLQLDPCEYTICKLFLWQQCNIEYFVSLITEACKKQEGEGTNPR